ncbi:MAG: hypothetical protein GX829_05145 [Clostridium sp.]|jgi:hypothetical protein|nr:hypothetical protein [Clostridium sp.]
MTNHKDHKDHKENPDHTKFYEAPESGTVVQETDPSSPKDKAKDNAKDSVGEAPESGTMREK